MWRFEKVNKGMRREENRVIQLEVKGLLTSCSAFSPHRSRFSSPPPPSPLPDDEACSPYGETYSPTVLLNIVDSVARQLCVVGIKIGLFGGVGWCL